MKSKKNIIYIAICLLAVAMIAGVYIYHEYNRKNPGLSAVKADFEKTAVQLIAEFHENEKKANADYSGKVILVTAPLKSVESADNGSVTLELGSQDDMSSVRCSMDSLFSAEAAKLKAGATVKIKCVCTGYNPDDMGLGADIILNRCVIDKGQDKK
jgi:hypothetical protein